MGNANSNIRGEVVKKILFDHSILCDAITSDVVAFYPNGFAPNRNNLMEIVKRSRPQRQDWRQVEIECLNKIAELCRGGNIIPYTSDELEAEELRALKFGVRRISAFDGIKFHKAIAPLDRSKWGLTSEQHSSKEDVISYCDCFFISPSDEKITRFINGMKKNPRVSLSEFEEKCLRKANVFRAICKGISKSHYPDALHYWTAELNELDAFLTVDKKFKNVMMRQQVNTQCGIMFPSELLSSLGSCSHLSI